MKTYYDYPRLLELLEAERQKYKADFTNPSDVEKNRVAITIVNAIGEAERHCQEIIRAINRVNNEEDA